MIFYIIQSTTALFLLLMIYEFVLKNSKFLQFNRFYLLASLVLCLIVPAFQIGIEMEAYENIANIKEAEEYASAHFFIDEASNVKSTLAGATELSYWSILLGIYFIISTLFVLRFAFNVYQLSRLILKKAEKFKGVSIIKLDQKVNPHSFLNYLFMNGEETESIFLNKAVLNHEKAHQKQLHSIDILMVELIHCFFWFNPMVFFYKRNIKMNHEYLADDFAARHQDEDGEYLYNLIDFVAEKKAVSLSSEFSYQGVKKRIRMMNQPKSNKMRIKLKISLAALLAVMLIGLTAFKPQRINHPIKIIDLDLGRDNIPSILPIEEKKIERIASHYGMRFNPILNVKKLHTGIDLAAPVGTAILATADGKVTLSEFSEGYGNHIKITHDQTYSTMYAHMASLEVKEGETVKAGQVIGLIGNSGKSLGVHLHYEVLKNGEKVNPVEYFEYDPQLDH